MSYFLKGTIYVMSFNKFPYYKQLDAMDCGPTCLRIIAAHYGKKYSLQFLRDKSYINREGVSFLNISDAAEAIGFRTLAARISIDKIEELPTPFIVHWQKKHFIVVYKIKNNRVYVSDPAFGLLKYSIEEFKKGFISVGKDEGFVLLLETTEKFYSYDSDFETKKTGFAFLFSYLKNYKSFLVQLVLGMVFGNLLGLIFPFLTQVIVDYGINSRDLNFIYVILIAQLILFFSKASVDLIRSWILLHISTRINISILSDFLLKMMKLPLSFFDSKRIGDLLQRIGDHRRIESFLTSTSLNILFSLFTLVMFSFVLAVYSFTIFWIFVVGTVLSTIWITVFMKKRKALDYKRFDRLSDNQSHLIQMIHGMSEIKLNNCEKQKRWEWEHIQAKLFKINVKSLGLNQFQSTGTIGINELKNIFITFVAAKSVIEGHMTLGMMMSVSYILGQLNSPVSQIIGFLQSAQDAKISLERMGEIHGQEDEEKVDDEKISNLPENKEINLSNVSFQYKGPQSEHVLKELNMTIPYKKTTAIVGVSGSGKTTLIKLLLKFYKETDGEIKISDINLEQIKNSVWRNKCGVVMQDGYIFSDTIASNIGLGEETIDKNKLLHATNISNIHDFIETLPLGYLTKIGQDGMNLSQGQKQRILIARAVYKDPEFLFFDEATSSLDANNEKTIMENLNNYLKNKTAIVVAHRLSTVKNADQIVVLDKGKIVEKGTHKELTLLKGYYFNLVKNQLELGN